MDENKEIMDNDAQTQVGPYGYATRYRMAGPSDAPADAPVQATPPPVRGPDFAPPPGYFIDSTGNLRKDRRKTDRRFNRFVAAILIICTIGAPFAGLGIGLGIRFFDRYILVRLMDDSEERNNFAFDNIHTPITHSHTGLDLPALVELVKPSTVLITAIGAVGHNPFGFGGFAPHAGSGVIIYETSTRFYIATNAHVIENAQSVHVSIAGSGSIPAVPVGRDDDEDLAVIAVYKHEAVNQGVTSVSVARFGDSEIVRVGETVLAIGNSMGEGNTVTDGIISAVNREIRVAGRSLLVLQTNAAINRGNSGGPLINMHGEVIGINTAKFTEELAEGMGYAIPSHVAKPVLTRLMHEYDLESRPMIGISIDPFLPHHGAALFDDLVDQGTDPDEIIIPEYGVLVFGVFRDSPAARAGLQVADIITAVNGQSVATNQEFIGILADMAVGDQITLTITRMPGQILEIAVTLGPHIRSF